MKHIKIFFTLIFLLSLSRLLGQNSQSEIFPENLIPHTPQVSSFMKYGDIPVSEYTGVPDITIPLYTINQGIISLPIELKYHGSGIKVNQEATWVGLGWDLMIGGSITRVIVEGNDDLCIYNQEEADWTTMISAHNGLMLPQYFTTTGYSYWGCWQDINEDPDISENVLHHLAEGGNRDYYAVNFPGHSFKFMFDPRDPDTPVFIGQKSKCRIQPYSNGFLITDEKGIKYYFTAREMVTDFENNLYCQNWFLSLIITPTGQHISFTYDNGAIYPLASLTEKRTVWDGVSSAYIPQSDIGYYRNIMNSVTSIDKLYPTSITTDKEIIEFAFGARTDYNGAGAVKLTGITIKDIDGNTKYKYRFNYSYFSSSNVGGDYFQDDDFFSRTISESLKGSRLKLENIERIDPGTSPESPEYSYQFQYNESINLPLKSSFAIDYWGYYNGQPNTSTLMNNYNIQHTLVPNARHLKYVVGTLPNELLEGGGANRGASKTLGTACMLKSITYPTGGKTVFEFEPNQFTNYNYYSAEDNIGSSYTHIQSVWDYNNSSSNEHLEFTITEAVTAHFEAVIQQWDFDDLLGNASVTFVGPLGPNPEIHSLYLDESMEDEYIQNGNQMLCIEDIQLVPGDYILHCNLDDNLGNTNYSTIVAGKVTYSGFTPPGSGIPTGGGLRVKSITNYDINGKALKKENYSYFGGKLLTPPKLFEKRTVELVTTTPSGTNCPKTSADVYKLSPSSFFETVNSSGAIIGYDKVEITETNASRVENGKRILSFTNTDGVTYFDKIKYFNFCTNGNLLKEVILDNAGDTVRVEKNTWELEDTQKELLNGFAIDNYFGPTDYCGVSSGAGIFYNSCIYDNRFRVYIYPLDNFQNSLTITEITDYTESGKISVLTNYDYSMDNYKVSSVSKVNSNGTETKQIKYSSDINAGIYSSMVSLNMLNYPIEQTVKVNGNWTKGTLTTYKSDDGNYVPSKTYSVETATPLTSFSDYNGSTMDPAYADTPEMDFIDYDTRGNLLKAQGKSGIYAYYVWAYNGQYPVAKIETSLNTTISPAINDNNLSKSDELGDINDDVSYLQGLLTSYISSNDYMVTIYTYKPLVGLTSETDPAGRTTYYEYDDFGRLELIRDQNDNIVKKYRYNYASQ